MNSEAPLRLRGVKVKYGSLTAVHDVDLDIPTGEILALLGPSGCGKSTLLRAIAGLEPLARGHITWKGDDLDKIAVHRRGVGLMFQDHALFPHHNVFGNIEFGLRMMGRDPKVRRNRVVELLSMVGLEGLEDRTIGTLSGGQAQRVALARALAPEPRLLLLDEPFGSLDRSLRDRLVSEIRGIVRQLDITAVHVTHDHDEAVSIADSLALMTEGRITKVGAVEELMARPGDPGTASALGIETVWRLSVEEGAVHTPFGALAVPAGIDEAHVLLRPESVRVADSGVAATVVANHHRGGDWLVTCQLSEEQMVITRHDQRLSEGSRIQLSADLGKAEILEG